MGGLKAGFADPCTWTGVQIDLHTGPCTEPPRGCLGDRIFDFLSKILTFLSKNLLFFTFHLFRRVVLGTICKKTLVFCKKTLEFCPLCPIKRVLPLRWRRWGSYGRCISQTGRARETLWGPSFPARVVRPKHQNPLSQTLNPSEKMLFNHR